MGEAYGGLISIPTTLMIVVSPLNQHSIMQDISQSKTRKNVDMWSWRCICDQTASDCGALSPKVFRTISMYRKDD